MDRLRACRSGLRTWWSVNLWAWRIEYSRGQFRWRTKARMFTPWWLLDRGLFEKPDKNCGSHDWYNADGVTAKCHHYDVGERPWPSVMHEWQQGQ